MEEKKDNFYKKGDSNKFQIYSRAVIYLIALIFIIGAVIKLNKSSKPKNFEELRNKPKVKAEIYGNGTTYNNYYYGVRISKVSADWTITKIKDVYDDKIASSAALEERIKPLARFTTKDREQEVASVILNTIILSEQRTSMSLAEEGFQDTLKKYKDADIKILKNLTPHTQGSLKAAFYVIEIKNIENPVTYIEVFIVKNKHAFNLHGETSPELYDTYIWDFEHYINKMVIYW